MTWKQYLVGVGVMGAVLIGFIWYQHEPPAEFNPLPKPPPVLAPFLGEPTPEPIAFDLNGTWNVCRFTVSGKLSTTERWEAKWRLRRFGFLVWMDDNGQGEFKLLTESPPQQILWVKSDGTRFWFSINEQSFGFLMMTGSDEERYMAVRSD